MHESEILDVSFFTGEVDPTYQDITNAQAISTWPPTNPSRWDVLIDGFIVGSTSYSVTTGVSGVPGGKAVALLDSGTSWTYEIDFPHRDGIYF